MLFRRVERRFTILRRAPAVPVATIGEALVGHAGLDGFLLELSQLHLTLPTGPTQAAAAVFAMTWAPILRDTFNDLVLMHQVSSPPPPLGAASQDGALRATWVISKLSSQLAPGAL